jgi:Amt family ammonium transporter
MPAVTFWMLAASALALLVPCGLLLLFTGFARAQNVTYVILTFLVLSSTALLGFWALGFAIEDHASLFAGGGADVAVVARLLLFAIIASIAAVIPAGTLIERWRLASAAVAGLIVATVIYPLVARWTWGGGWLARLGVSSGLGHGLVDYAGSGVVHAVGGFVALAGAMIVGSRTGKFTRDGQATAMPGHSVPMFTLGSLLVVIGWFGLALGLALPDSTAPPALAATNGVLASAAALLAAIGYSRWQLGSPDASLVANALVAGVVSISAGAPFVSPGSAVLIGAISAPLAIASVLLIERKARLDDPAGAISVHAVCGVWGLIAAGLFANGRNGEGWNGVPGTIAGLFAGNAAQLGAQVVGAVVVAAFAFGAGWLLFLVLGQALGNRVSRTSEMDGLDAAELGTSGYPDFATRDSDR